MSTKEVIVYYSKNNKNPPFKVTIEVDDQLIYINCNCPLGQQKKICRHKINAIRGDDSKKADITSTATIEKLKQLFGGTSTLRQHLEKEWRSIREYSYEYPENVEGIQQKRKILGEVLANGFINTHEDRYLKRRGFRGTEQILNDAIGTGEILTIIYHGGSQAGAIREVLPIKITGNKVRARCYTSNAVKTFVIDKIELCFDQISTPSTWNVSAKNTQKFKNLNDVYLQLKDELLSLGWHVKFTEEESNDFCFLTLHFYFKNGKVRKTPKVYLNYNKYTTVSIFNESSGKITYTDQKRESKKPYCTQSRAFGKIDRAVELFMTQAREKAPVV